MKQLTPNALTEIAKRYGTEPLTLVQIEWTDGSYTIYSDREIENFEGKIVNIGQINSSLNLASYTVTEVEVTLDDIDGSIRKILEENDIHKRPALIYQMYGGLTSGDKFNVFKGQISTPIEWSETERLIVISIISEIEEQEIGFSPEEGQLDFVSDAFVGKPWPLCFGQVMYAPAQKIREPVHGTLLDVLGLHDVTLDLKLLDIERAFQVERLIFEYFLALQDAARSIAPTAEEILIAFLKNVLDIHAAMLKAMELQAEIQKQEIAIRKNPASVIPRANYHNAVFALDTQWEILNLLGVQRQLLYHQIELMEFEFKLKRYAAEKEVEAYDNMRRLYGLYVETNKQLCEQRRLERDFVRVEHADYFPDDTEIDVVIKDVQARVKFHHADKTMEILNLPIPRYTNISVSDWTPEDVPCNAITDGLDLFRLSDPNPPSLEDLYLLVKRRNSSDPNFRHIVKVTKQVGNKVYFELVEWDRSADGGAPRQISIDSIIKGVEETPFTLGAFGAEIPLEVFTGGLDPNIWARPEGQLLLKILANIPGGVSPDELRAITRLVFRMPQDSNLEVFVIEKPTPRTIYTIIGEDIESIEAASAVIIPEWLTTYEIPKEEIPQDLFWQAEAGSSIYEAGPDCVIYVANLLPSTIKAVHAYRTNTDGERYLAPIPSRYYEKQEAVDLTGYVITALIFKRALINIPGENWEDDVYITMESSVGRNVVDVIQWIIETYTNKAIDATSFADVKTKCENYPVDFCLFDRVNVIQELQRIAWEARLALILTNDIFYLKYLAEEPVSDDTIDNVHVKHQSLVIRYSETENLVTRLIATYNRDYLPVTDDKPDRIILRHNIKKYGLHPREEHFHIYSERELVEKSASFHMVRLSNTWKLVTLSTFQTKIRLDVLDTVTLDLTPHLPVVKAIVIGVTYDLEQNIINLIVDPGIRVGEIEQYQFFWPASLPPGTEYTDSDQIGGDGPGPLVAGTIGDCLQ